ncbi:hypothetical protein K9L81_03065 [Candidatus Gracilibacteria bacterium]|nr:hypothetical protein [Candidatus Gracilibacteria bacterium]
MKKIITSLGLAMLLTGCGFGSGPAEEISPETPASHETAQTTLTDDSFIAFSAEILCLPSNNASASDSEIENLAKKVLADAGVDEEDFSIYQQTIEADPASKNALSLAIVGKMSEFCQIVEGGEIVVEPEDEEIEAPIDSENNEEEVITEGDDSGSDPLVDLFANPAADQVSETPAE